MSHKRKYSILCWWDNDFSYGRW